MTDHQQGSPTRTSSQIPSIMSPDANLIMRNHCILGHHPLTPYDMHATHTIGPLPLKHYRQAYSIDFPDPYRPMRHSSGELSVLIPMLTTKHGNNTYSGRRPIPKMHEEGASKTTQMGVFTSPEMGGGTAPLFGVPLMGVVESENG